MIRESELNLTKTFREQNVFKHEVRAVKDKTDSQVMCLFIDLCGRIKDTDRIFPLDMYVIYSMCVY